MTGSRFPKARNTDDSALPTVSKKLKATYKRLLTVCWSQSIIGTGAFAGLRLGEIRGLWVDDDEGHVLNIRRSVSRTIVKDTKAAEGEEDPGVVPIIRPLRLLVDRVKPVCG